jgi:hypothetical protein
MKNLLKKVSMRLNLTQEKIALLDLDLWEQKQEKEEQRWRHIKNECSGIKGTYLDKKGNVIFKI